MLFLAEKTADVTALYAAKIIIIFIMYGMQTKKLPFSGSFCFL